MQSCGWREFLVQFDCNKKFFFQELIGDVRKILKGEISGVGHSVDEANLISWHDLDCDFVIKLNLVIIFIFIFKSHYHPLSRIVCSLYRSRGRTKIIFLWFITRIFHIIKEKLENPYNWHFYDKYIFQPILMLNLISVSIYNYNFHITPFHHHHSSCW